MGRYAYISILVGNAARAGAGYGAQSLAQSVDTAGITTAVDNDFQNNGLNINKPQCRYLPPHRAMMTIVRGRSRRQLAPEAPQGRALLAIGW